MRGLILWFLLMASALGHLPKPTEHLPKSPEKPPIWLSRVTGQPAGSFPPPRPFHGVWVGSWSGIPAGQIEIHFSGDRRQLRLQGTCNTTGLARVLFRLDASFDSKIDRKTLLPSQTHIVETYSDEKRDTVQTYTRDQLINVRKTVPPPKNDGKPRVIRLPGLYDLQGALLYIRSQPLHPGDKIVFVACATDAPYLATVTVDGPEKISVPAGKYATIRLNLQLTSIDKKLALKPYQKARELKVWLSDDADRLLLQIRGELFIGAVLVELQKAEFK